MRKDFSSVCNGDDDDLTNPCWECIYFIFPNWLYDRRIRQ